METMTEQEARELADEFIATHPYPEAYTLEFRSIRQVGGAFQVRYTKVFKEPAKESPPYRLVIVTSSGKVRWGRS